MNELIKIAGSFSDITSLGGLWAWFWALPLTMKFVVFFGAFGCFAVLFIFIIALFTDKNQLH